MKAELHAINKSLLAELKQKMKHKMAAGLGDEPMSPHEMKAEAAEEKLEDPKEEAMESPAEEAAEDKMEDLGNEHEPGARETLNEKSLEGAAEVGKGTKLAEINGTDPGHDPAKVSSAPEHVPGHSAMDKLKKGMTPGAKTDLKETLRDFLKGSGKGKPSAEGVTVSMIGVGKPKKGGLFGKK